MRDGHVQSPPGKARMTTLAMSSGDGRMIDAPTRDASRASVDAWRSWRAFAVLLVVLAALAAGTWPWRATILTGAANLWVVSDQPLAPADAIVVLGGGLEMRPSAAAAYFREHLAPRILVANVSGARRS